MTESAPALECPRVEAGALSHKLAAARLRLVAVLLLDGDDFVQVGEE